MDGYHFSVDVRVRFSETDAQGIANNAVYLNWFEVARVSYLARFPGGYRGLIESGVEALTIEAKVRYLAPCGFDDELRIHTRVTHLRGAPLPFRVRRRADERARPEDRRRLDRARLRRRDDAATDQDAHLAGRGDRGRRGRLTGRRPAGAGGRAGRRPGVCLLRGRRFDRNRLRPVADDLRLGDVVRVPRRVEEDLALGVVDDPPHRHRARRLAGFLDGLLADVEVGIGDAFDRRRAGLLQGRRLRPTRRWSGVPNRRTVSEEEPTIVRTRIQWSESFWKVRSVSG